MDANDNEIAIVGMSLRVPGARSPAQYWKNLCAGVESVRTFSDEELLRAGVSAALLRDPLYVKSGGILEEVEHFDAEFFGFNPKEAAIMDPQHRHFLECVWEALEDAAHPPDKFPGRIGVFAGCGMGAYFAFNILTNPDLVRSVGLFLLRHTGNDKDFLATRVSYLLDLRGPSVNVQTACSTSLVAVHIACQSLLLGECEMALAGGVTIEVPHVHGYLYQEGEVLSRDGHCRAFDHRSSGTVLTSGVGVVVLRRLADALADGDRIYAVIKGSAINNDGAQKVGYLAPSVDGQAAAMAEALAVSGVDPQAIDFIECHGTGTYIGDPIEITALTQAYHRPGQEYGRCALGSVKTNIGHLDTAAGVASLIKAALSLDGQCIAPIVNFEQPNPTIDFASTPFYVNEKPRDWRRGRKPRHCAVNSLGVGGTNAHVILAEAPAPAARPAPKPHESQQLLLLSARNAPALDENARRLAARLREQPELELRDVAHTLLYGRRAFARRRVLAVRDRDEAIRLLESNDPQRCFTHVAGQGASIAFLLPGGGAQHPRMGIDLYQNEPVFREHVDRGLAILEKQHGIDLRPLLLAPEAEVESAARALEKTTHQLPAVFIISYALAQLWRSRGVEPAVLLGHSLGENTAACLAGVFEYEEAIGLVVLRGRLVEQAPRGGMLSVELSEERLRPLLGDELDLAIVNGPTLCVASGAEPALAALAARLEKAGAEHQRVRISVAGHSRLLEPILAEFGAYLRSIRRSPPRIPIISNRTGRVLTDAQATDPDYWVGHLRNTIRFADGVGTLLEDPARVLLEVGPGRMCSSLARQHPALRATQHVIPSMRHPNEALPDTTAFLAATGRLWAAGAPVDLELAGVGAGGRRVSLPTYAFQRQRYWIEAGKSVPLAAEEERNRPLQRREDLSEWFYRPEWRSYEPATRPLGADPMSWLVFADAAGVGNEIARRLARAGHTVSSVREGDTYRQNSLGEYVLAPEHGRDGYRALLRDLTAAGRFPSRIVHLWLVTAEESFRPGSSFFHRNQERGFYSLLFLAQALAEEGTTSPLHLLAVSNGAQQVDKEPLRYPDKATALGPLKVLPREFPSVTASSLDIELAPAMRRRGAARKADAQSLESLAEAILREAGGGGRAARRRSPVARVARGGVPARSARRARQPRARRAQERVFRAPPRTDRAGRGGQGA